MTDKAKMYFSDILNKVNVSPEEVKLIRHALSDKGFYSCYQEGKIVEYTRQQKPNFSKGYKYWAVFISDSGNYARFYGLFQVGNHVPDTVDVAPDGFPHPEWFKGESAYYDLFPVEELDIYRDRLLIDWGPAAIKWHQKGTSEKEIIALRSDPKKVFPGFDNVLLDFGELKEVFDNPVMYADWKTALSSVKAVYLISDTYDGRLYVGSAYGKDGLWGRWGEYVATRGHGNNKLLAATLKTFPDRYKYLQWSILQILPMNATDQHIIENVENHWKKKLLSREFGYNKSEIGWEQEQFILESISLLQRINDTPALLEWCQKYSPYGESDDYGLEKQIYKEMMIGAYDHNLVPQGYMDTINEAINNGHLTWRQVSDADAEQLAELSTKELVACIAYHFRYDYNTNGALIYNSIASGAMLRMLLELQKRR